MLSSIPFQYNTLVKKFKIKINIIIDIKRLTKNNIKWEVNISASIISMKEKFVNEDVGNKKGILFTGKDISDLYANTNIV